LQYWLRFEWHPAHNLYDYRSRYLLVPWPMCTTWAQHIYLQALNIFMCILLIMHFLCTQQKIARLLREFSSPVWEHEYDCKFSRELYCTWQSSCVIINYNQKTSEICLFKWVILLFWSWRCKEAHAKHHACYRCYVFTYINWKDLNNRNYCNSYLHRCTQIAIFSNIWS